MTVASITPLARYAAEHGIDEVVHFTTHKGLLGISFTDAVLPRARLRKEEILEFIFTINAEKRLDTAWFDHVNLSLNNINRRYFAASKMWHPDLWWVILAFDPMILNDDGVMFVNTNNGWRSGVTRAPGLKGLKMVYEDDVDHGAAPWGSHKASGGTSPACPQAEVLYPGPLSLQHLRRVYVRDQSNYREASSFLTFLEREVPVVIDPDRFLPHPNDPCRR